MSIRAVIFDLDGTITEPFWDFDAIRREIGLTPQAGTILEEMDKMTPAQKQRAWEIIDAHEKRAVENSTLNIGAKKLLEKLRSDGIGIGIITRNKRANVIAIAEKHGLIFDAIVDRDDGPVKPDAFGILKLCQHFKVKPNQVIVVGDYIYDVLSAKAAEAIAVLLKNHPKADDFQKYSDYAIEKIEQILEIIQKES